MTKIVANGSWLTQIEHTLMAAEALRNTGGRQKPAPPGLNPLQRRNPSLHPRGA
jgi:hypothetical protein